MEERSFGIIPVYKDKDSYRVLLVRSQKYGHWGWPKGRGEPGEDPVAAAKREFREETGIKKFLLVHDLELVEKWTFKRQGQPITKTAWYFLGLVNKQPVTPQAGEISDYKWVTFAAAEKLLDFDAKKSVLRQVEKYLAGIKLAPREN